MRCGGGVRVEKKGLVVYIYRGRARSKVRGRFRGRSKGRFKGKVKERVRGRVRGRVIHSQVPQPTLWSWLGERSP